MGPLSVVIPASSCKVVCFTNSDKGKFHYKGNRFYVEYRGSIKSTDLSKDWPK